MKTVTEQLQIHIRSEMLGLLRKIDGMKEFLGPLAQFNVVIDTNIILGDLKWLVGERRNPEATTALVESIKAGTIVAYVTKSVLAEVDEHISTLALRYKLPEDVLRQQWESYRREFLECRTPSKKFVEYYKNIKDPDDAPIIALEKTIRADGILSKDKAFPLMGGIVIDLDFVNRTRDYSRKTAIVATIHCSGGIVFNVSWVLIEAVLKSLADAIKSFRRLPTSVQIVILLAAITIASNKNMRKRAITMIEPVITVISSTWPDVLEWLTNIGEILAENTVESPVPIYKNVENREEHS